MVKDNIEVGDENANATLASYIDHYRTGQLQTNSMKCLCIRLYKIIKYPKD